MLHNNPTLKSLINSLWTALWSGGITNPITAIEQITYLLFMKRLDQIETEGREKALIEGKNFNSRFSGLYEPYVDETKFTVLGTIKSKEQRIANKELEDAKRPRPKQELKWSFFKNMEGEMLVEHVRYNVFPFLKELNGKATPFTKYMVNAVFLIEKPSLLAESIKRIEEIFLEIERDASEGGHTFQDIQGDVYEMLLSEISQSGKNGQFRTPRHIIKLMAELLEPKLEDTICDPACGTAGFLLGAYQHILTDSARKRDVSVIALDEDGFERGLHSDILSQQEKESLEKKLVGFDIDQTMVRLGLMNLIMHGFDNPQLQYRDTLSKTYEEVENFSIILANPPFTGSIDKNEISRNFRIKTFATELLFVDRISSMLSVGGKGAVVIPEGVLFGSSKAQKAAKEIILKDNNLEAVISLPKGAFRPYTGVKTSILIFTKVKENSEVWNTKEVWFYGLKSDGYTLDDTRRRLNDFPLPEALSLFRNRYNSQKPNRKSDFFVSIEEIRANDLDISYNRYKEYEYIEPPLQDPKHLLSEVLRIEKELLIDLEELNGLL